MKVKVTKIATLAVAAVFGTAATVWAVPVVSNVTMSQRPNSRMVDIGYTLSGEQAIVTVSIETNGVAIPDSAVTRLTGEVCKVVQPGSYAITWNAGADWPQNITETAKARVTAWCVDAPPLYCVVDLSAGYATNNYPVSYHLSAEALPGGGLTNDLYRMVWLAMRRVRTTAAYPEDGNGMFMMGSPYDEIQRDNMREDYHQVTLTNEFYVGVFQVTQGHWHQVMNTRPSFFDNTDYWRVRPVEQVTYNNIRGPSDGAGWPDNSEVDNGSFMYQLRDKTGLDGFDLPTEAQWEYACRAGTDRALSVPLPSGSNLTNSNADTNMDLAGRYRHNGGRVDGTGIPRAGCTTENATAKVGIHAPNAWGLYDMHGNVWERCLDWYGNGAGQELDGHLGTGKVTDPRGADEGSHRVIRGGSWYHTASDCRSARRDRTQLDTSHYTSGFRLVRKLP